MPDAQARKRSGRPATSTSRIQVGSLASSAPSTAGCQDTPRSRAGADIHLGHWEIDCYWPEHELALELDGRPYHTVIEDIERDNRKNTWLQAHGIRILRVTDSRWRRDRKGVHHDLTTLLALGATPRAA